MPEVGTHPPAMTHRPGRRPRRARRGVTLLETMLATIVVGTAVLALCRLTFVLIQQSATTQKNTVGMMLADNVREMLAELPFADPRNGSHLGGPDSDETTLAQYNDIQDFDGFVADPPVDANRQALAGMTGYRQRVSVTLVGDNNGHSINGIVNNTGAIVARITVSVDHQGPDGSWSTIASMTWLRGRG